MKQSFLPQQQKKTSCMAELHKAFLTCAPLDKADATRNDANKIQPVVKTAGVPEQSYFAAKDFQYRTRHEVVAQRKKRLDEKHKHDLQKLLEGWNEKKKQLEVTKEERIKQMQEQRRTASSKTPQRSTQVNANHRQSIISSSKPSARGGSIKPSQNSGNKTPVQEGHSSQNRQSVGVPRSRKETLEVDVSVMGKHNPSSGPQTPVGQQQKQTCLKPKKERMEDSGRYSDQKKASDLLSMGISSVYVSK